MATVPRTLLLILAAAMALPASLAAQTITVTVGGTDPNSWDVGSFGPGDVLLRGTTSPTTSSPLLQ